MISYIENLTVKETMNEIISHLMANKIGRKIGENYISVSYKVDKLDCCLDNTIASFVLKTLLLKSTMTT